MAEDDGKHKNNANGASKHKNDAKWGCLAQEQCQMRLLSTSKITNVVAKHKNNANEVAKEENDGKLGC